MVKSFHVTDSDRKIAFYAGMITSSFTFAEFSAGLFWGRMSDRIGRKPVLLIGLIGTAVSMAAFGFSSNLPTAMVARALGGLLNGNIGVLQTTVAEIVTIKDHQPLAYSIMPFVWCLGSIIGPALGGALAQPCNNYPGVFPRGTIFDRFPFLLPNLVCIVILGLGIVIGFLFLEETHVVKRDRYDPGLKLGRWLLGKCSAPHVMQDGDKNYVLLVADPPPKYRSREGSPFPSSLRDISTSSLSSDLESEASSEVIGFTKAFTKQVVFNIIGYGILA
jgi:MFS family permease